MMQGRHIPVVGIVLALVTGAVMAIAGTNVMLVLAAMLVWIASLWLAAPAPLASAPPESDSLQLTPVGLRELIEHSGLAMLVLDGNRIERCFNKLKHFRRFATRYDRLATHFLAFIQLAAAMIWMR